MTQINAPMNNIDMELSKYDIKFENGSVHIYFPDACEMKYNNELRPIMDKGFKEASDMAHELDKSFEIKTMLGKEVKSYSIKVHCMDCEKRNG